MRPIPRLLILLLAVSLPLGCGGGDDDPAGTGGASLDAVTLATAQSSSLARVGIEGLPSGVSADDLQVLVLGVGGTEHPLPVDEDGSGLYFTAPLHPATPNQGGDATLFVTDGTNRSSELSLTLEPLPAAPGAYARVVDALRDLIDQRAQWAGTDIEALSAQGFEEVDLEMLPLRAALGFVDDDEPGDLMSLAVDEAGFLTADQRELLDRIFGYAPLDQLIRADMDSFAAGNPPPPMPRKVTARRRACADLGPSISTAQELSDAMLSSALANVAIDPGSAPGRTLEALGVVLAGGGVLPVYGKVFSTVGAGVAAWTATADFIRSVYPSSLVSLSFDLDRPEFNEDETALGQWSNVQVIAASSGWMATKSLANLVISAIGAHVSVNQSLAIEDLEVLRDIAITGANTAYGEFLDGREGGIEFCAKTWDIDVTGLPWSTGGVLDHKFDVNVEQRQIRPLEIGPDVLRVAAQSSQFGGREVHEDLSIRTHPINVNVLPSELVVRELGETINVTATIEHANDEELYWDAQAGTWADALGVTTPGSAVRALTTPTNPDFYPFLVRIESLSRDGLRESGTPPRLAFLTVKAEADLGLLIEPQYACIQPGETQQFTATVTGFEDYTVVWNVVEGYGSIDQNGLYQSLSQGTSNAVIEAKLQEDERISGTANLDAAACNCSLNIKITGDATWNRQSSQAAYLVSNFGELFYQFFLNFDGDGDPNIAASLGGIDDRPAPIPGQTGSWKASFVFVSGGQSWVSSWDEELPLPGVSINITSLTETSMEGSFTGNAFQFDENNDISSIIGVDVQFRAGLWDGGEWPCQ